METQAGPSPHSAQVIMNAIAVFMLCRSTGFKHMVKVLELCINVPSMSAVLPCINKDKLFSNHQQSSSVFQRSITDISGDSYSIYIDSMPVFECLNCYSKKYGQ